MNIDVLNTKQKIALAVIIFILFIIAGFYLKSIFSSTVIVSTEVSELYKKVLTMTNLPKDEIPTLVTVNSKDNLPSNYPFQDAQNGDKILVFEKNKLAVLYRPSSNTVVSAVMADDLVAKAQGSREDSRVMGAETKSINIALYNDKSGELKKVLLGFERSREVSLNISSPLTGVRSNAKYSQPQIMDITGKNSQLVKEMAALINANIISFPADKVTIQNIDIMVVGK